MKILKALFWEVVARLGGWVPCSKHLPDKRFWDWVLISYYEPGLTYRYVPKVAEFSHTKQRWHDMSENGNEDFLNKVCRVTHWHKIPQDRHLKVREHHFATFCGGCSWMQTEWNTQKDINFARKYVCPHCKGYENHVEV